MAISKRIIRVVLLAADEAVQAIHDQLDALDPVTRAAVIARLTSQEVKKVRDHRS